MLVVRLPDLTTTENAAAVISLLKDERTERVTFFATESTSDKNYRDSHGVEQNLPLVAVLAEGRLLGPVKMVVVGDGVNFLMATRSPRAGEVKEVTDAAVKSNKAYFTKVRAPFTAHLEPEKAAGVLCKLDAVPLTAATLGEYRNMLCAVAEVWE